jgi:DNA-binding FadR family transcriptional regulator
VHGVVTHALTALQSTVAGGRPDLTADDDAAIVSAHRTVYEAIAGRDPDAARAAMYAHIIDIEQRLGRVGVERAAS